MRKRSPTAMLVVGAAAFACGSERIFEPKSPLGPDPVEPERPPAFALLEIRPTAFGLATAAPGNTLQLTVWAYDRAGEVMQGTGAAVYSSSAPAIAEVSSSGVVTAVAPGTTEITVSLTLGGITRTASTTATVQARDYSGSAGVYDLEGYRYTAVLTLEEQSGPPWFAGTYADLKLTGPGGDSYDVADTGLVTGSIAFNGRVLIELLGDGNSIDVTLIVDTVDSGVIDGTFGCCGQISGTFTAERRRAE